MIFVELIIIFRNDENDLLKIKINKTSVDIHIFSTISNTNSKDSFRINYYF